MAGPEARSAAAEARGSQAWTDAPGPEAGKEKPSFPPVSATDHRFPADQPEEGGRAQDPARGGLLLLPPQQIGAEQRKSERGSQGLGPLCSAPRTADRPTALSPAWHFTP